MLSLSREHIKFILRGVKIPYSKEGKTAQCPRDKRTNNDLQNTTQKTKH